MQILKTSLLKAKKFSGFKSYDTLLLLLLCTCSSSAWADGCEAKNAIKHLRMSTDVGTIQLTGKIKAGDEIARFSNFHNNSNTPYVAECSPNATIYALAGAGQPTMGNAIKSILVDGKQTYRLPKTFQNGAWQYSYRLIDNDSGLDFESSPSNAPELAVQDDKMRPRNATVILYAAKDDPVSIASLFQVELGGLRPKAAGEYQTGITYMLQSGRIESAPASCILENPHNLSIQLPRSPLSAFNHIGSTYAKEKTDLNIQCTGEMQAKISLKLDNNTVVHDEQGQNTVIKNELEQQATGAQGIGFVLSTAEGTRLANESQIILKDLGTGVTHVPIYAEYYRYGHQPSTGPVQAIAGFVIEFN